MTRQLSCAEKFARIDDLQAPLSQGEMPRWLAAGERETADRWRHAQRRQQWLAGRWLAKALIAETPECAEQLKDHCNPRDVFIHSRDGRGRGVRPQVYLRGRLQPWSLSISHTDHAVLVALATEPGTTVGVDLAEQAELDPRLAQLWFTKQERVALADSEEPLAGTKIWAVKEAVYKAVNRNDSFSPRDLKVELDGQGGATCQWAGVPLNAACRIRIRSLDGQIAVVALADREQLADGSVRQTARGTQPGTENQLTTSSA